MRDLLVIVLITVLVIAVVVTEVLSAVLPPLLVIVLVPPEERAQLAELIATACDTRRFGIRLAIRIARRRRRGVGMASGVDPVWIDRRRS